MNEKDEEIFMEAINFEPKSSITVDSHGKPDTDKFYYTWKVKVYCDDLESALGKVKECEKTLREKYGSV